MYFIASCLKKEHFRYPLSASTTQHTQDTTHYPSSNPYSFPGLPRVSVHKLLSHRALIQVLIDLLPSQPHVFPSFCKFCFLFSLFPEPLPWLRPSSSLAWSSMFNFYFEIILVLQKSHKSNTDNSFCLPNDDIFLKHKT